MHWLRNLNKVRVFVQNCLGHRRAAAGKKRVLFYDMWTLRNNKIRNWDDDSAATDGDVKNAVPSEEGRPPGSYYFESKDTVVIPAFPLTGTALSFCAWVRCSNYAGSHQNFIAGGALSGTVGHIRVVRVDDTDYLGWGYANGTASMRWQTWGFFDGYEDAWVHLAIVCDYTAKTVRFYRNGILYEAADLSGTPVFPDTSLIRYLGVQDAAKLGSIRNGYMDEVQLWEGALTDAEVLAVYDEYVPP